MKQLTLRLTKEQYEALLEAYTKHIKDTNNNISLNEYIRVKLELT